MIIVYTKFVFSYIIDFRIQIENKINLNLIIEYKLYGMMLRFDSYKLI